MSDIYYKIENFYLNYDLIKNLIKKKYNVLHFHIVISNKVRLFKWNLFQTATISSSRENCNFNIKRSLPYVTSNFILQSAYNIL